MTEQDSTQAAGLAYMDDLRAMTNALRGTALEGVKNSFGIEAPNVILARLCLEENGRRLLIPMEEWDRLECRIAALEELVVNLDACLGVLSYEVAGGTGLALNAELQALLDEVTDESNL